jgi:hypothetical protein
LSISLDSKTPSCARTAILRSYAGHSAFLKKMLELGGLTHGNTNSTVGIIYRFFFGIMPERTSSPKGLFYRSGNFINLSFYNAKFSQIKINQIFR